MHRDVENGSSTGRHRDHVEVVQESNQAVVGRERFRRLLQGVVLSEGEKRGSERVPLLAAFALGDVPTAARGVPPAVRGRAPFRRHLAEFAEEGLKIQAYYNSEGALCMFVLHKWWVHSISVQLVP